MKTLLMRPALRDLVAALLLVGVAVVAPQLEESSRELWITLPLLFATPLFCSGVLFLLSWQWSRVVALLIHAGLFVMCAGVLLISAFCLVTVLFAGTALVLGPPALLLGMNSAATLSQALRSARSASSGE